MILNQLTLEVCRCRVILNKDLSPMELTFSMLNSASLLTSVDSFHSQVKKPEVNPRQHLSDE